MADGTFMARKVPGEGAPRGPLYPRSVPHDLTYIVLSRYILCSTGGEKHDNLMR